MWSGCGISTPFWIWRPPNKVALLKVTISSRMGHGASPTRED